MEVEGDVVTMTECERLVLYGPGIETLKRNQGYLQVLAVSSCGDLGMMRDYLPVYSSTQMAGT